MTDSELEEIKEAINAAKQYSEDNPEGDYERLLIAVLPFLMFVHQFGSDLLNEGLALSIARAINKKK